MGGVIIMNSMSDWLRRNKIDIALLVTVAIILDVFAHWQMNGATITFHDTDDYMQLVRIRDFFRHHDWFNNTIDRCNVPFGGELHWTRFYDLFLIVPSYILSFFTNSINDAIEYVGFFISPIVHAFTVVFFFHFAQFLMTKRNAFLCTAVFASHQLILPYETFGRPDHHAFILMFVLIFLSNLKGIGVIFDSNEDNFLDVCWKYTLKMSLITAMGIWLSPELLILFLIADGVLYLWWLFGYGKYDFFDSRRILQYICLKNTATALLICVIIFHEISGRTIVLAILLTFSCVVLRFCGWSNPRSPEDIPNKVITVQRQSPLIFETIAVLVVLLATAVCTNFNAITYDCVSFVHLVLYLYAAAFMWICGNYCLDCEPRSRFINCLCYFTLLLVFFLELYEKFFLGLAADVSDYLKKIWMHRVLEMQSPFQLGYDVLFVTLAVLELGAIGLRIVDLVQIWKTTDQKKALPVDVLVWSVLIAHALCYLLLAAVAWRMMPYAMIFWTLLMVWLIMHWSDESCCQLKVFFHRLPGKKIFNFHVSKIYHKIFTEKTHDSTKPSTLQLPLLRFGITAFLVPLLMVTTVPREDDDQPQQHKGAAYGTSELFREVDNLSAIPVVIMAHCNLGPQLLYYTKHKVIGAPYHRQHQGISASYEVMEAAFSQQNVEKILAATGASYIFIKKTPTQLKKNEQSNKNGSPSLTDMIIGGQLPPWISIENFPKKFNDVIIAKIHRNLLTKK